MMSRNTARVIVAIIVIAAVAWFASPYVPLETVTK